MPNIRPFRALRYEAEVVGDLALVTSPPYDVIGPDEQRALLARHPKNVVRLDLPGEELGDEPDDKYRRAARIFAAWRSDGTFHKDPRPAIYVYDQTYRLPGVDGEVSQRGFFARVRLEPFGEGGILPHERTLAAPREDRYRLLRATGREHEPGRDALRRPDRSGGGAARRHRRTAPAPGPVADVTDADHVRHRLWVVPGRAATRTMRTALRRGGAPGRSGDRARRAWRRPGPLTIADGHHRYETALRYRDERRMSRSCEEDPAFDYVLALLARVDRPDPHGPADPPARRRPRATRGAVLARCGRALFDVEPVAGRDALEAAFGPAQRGPAATAAVAASGSGRAPAGPSSPPAAAAFEADLPAGGDGAPRPRRDAPPGRPGAPPGHRRRGHRRRPAVVHAFGARGARPGRRRRRRRRCVPARSDAGRRRSSAVARDGDVMPQKSTYFFPKPLSGLLINPHEW